MRKNSFILLTTLILIFIFSFLIINIFEVKSLNSQNINNQYRFIQAKNHLNFLQDYIKSLTTLKLLDTISIKDDKYNIYATIEKKEENYEIDIYVKAKDFNISLHKKIFRKKES
ncbi:MAG: hypothetical protein ACNI25_10930 [Halarcobacter sp.]